MPASAFSACERADVVGGLLAADVLLARLQRQDEAAAAVGVGGLAGDPAGHAAEVLLGGGEEAERGAAEVEAVAERLALADGDVDAALAGGRRIAERDRVDGGDAERAGVVGERRRAPRGPRSRRGSRVLDEHGGGLVVEGCGELAASVSPSVEPDLDHLGPKPRRRCAGSRGCADAGPARRRAASALARPERQVGRGGHRRRALVERGVRDRGARSAPRSRSGTRTSPGGRPARPRAGTACTGSRNSEREMIASTSAGT